MPRIYLPSAWNWISLSGPDALDFLHRLTTVNIRALEPGRGAKGCFLTGQGKIRAIFTLWQYGSQDFAFEADAGKSGSWKTALLETIDQFTFGEKMQLTAVEGLETRWLFADTASEADEHELLTRISAPDLKENQTLAIDEEIRICHHGKRDYGRAWISVWARPQRLRQWLDRALGDAEAATNDLLEQWRIEATRPALDSEITTDTIPLEVGLIDAIAQQKGCYPGQEVVERIIALGAPARRLCRVEGSGRAPSPGTAVLNESGAEIGQVTSAMTIGDHFIALAMIRKLQAKEGTPAKFPNTDQSGTVTGVAAYA